MLASVMVLFGSTVVSVHAARPSVRRAAATESACQVRLFMSRSPSLEADAQPTREGARARIDVVVDPDEASGRVDSAVPGEREHVLQRAVHPQLLAPVRERIAGG